MRIRVERLRIWLLGSAVFLVLVIAAFIGSARYIRHRLMIGLPAKLGANVRIDSTGVTWNHVDQGRITYTIHAAKDIEHTDGKIALHDVWIKLYGRKQDRSDMIRGDDWEWDQKAGVVHALGVVHIDLQGGVAAAGPDGVPANDSASGAGNAAKGDAGAAASRSKVLHVTTSDLVYMDKLGVAATSAPIEFESGAMTGHAMGADYSSDSGVLMLHSAVSMSGTSGGRPVEVNASAAELDDQDRVVLLTHARYSSRGRTAEAEQATLHLRADQTLERVEAQGKVTVEENGATMAAERADVALNAASHPRTALLTGGVRYSADGPLRQLRGEAQQAAIDFDGQASPQPQHALFTGAVHMIERTRAADAAREAVPRPWSVRELTAAKVEAALGPSESGASKAELRDVEATGGAHFTAVNNGSAADARGMGAGTGAGAGTTELSADDLKAHLLAAVDAKQPPQLDTIAGLGHTLVRQLSADGVEQTSAGDTLDAKFRPASAGAGKARAAGGAGGGAALLGAQTIASAVQQGHVVVTRNETAKRAASASAKNARQAGDIQRATAQQAAYDGTLDRVVLTGGVQLTQAGSELWTNQLALDHATGDAHATGAVKVDYVQSDAAQTGQRAGAQRSRSEEPTHILADRAELEHATDVATFYGKPARLWQGPSQVQAPVIELSRAQKRLIARGDAATGGPGAAQPAQVHTVLMNTAGDRPASAQQGTAQTACATTTAATGKPGPQQQAARIASGGLMYSGTLGQADFTGGMRAETADATIRASQGIVYLDSATGVGGAPAAAPSLAGDLDHVVASGQVVIDASGLHATGERMLYTAADQVFLLTGDSKNPPRAVDIRGNTTTGAALRFHHACEAAGGDTVEALGQAPNEPAERVHTESRVSGNPRKEKEVR